MIGLHADTPSGEPHRLFDSIGAPPEFMDGRELRAQADPDSWYPEKGGDANPAKNICHACPLEAECLEWAIEHNERFGVWGGHSERERRRIARGRAA